MPWVTEWPKAQWVADGQYHVAHPGGIGVAQGDGLQVGQVHLQHRQIGRRVGADDHRIGRAPVLQQYLDGIGAGDDVVIGQDMAGFGDNHAGAQGALDALALGRPSWAKRGGVIITLLGVGAGAQPAWLYRY